MDSSRSINDNDASGFTAHELEAVAGLLKLSQSDQRIPTTEASTEDSPQASDANKADRSTDANLPRTTGQIPATGQTPATCDSNTERKTWFHDLLPRVPLKNFMRYGVRPTQLDAEGERRIAEVLVEMPERSSIQEAAWYLDANNWNAQDAVAQYQRDETIRADFQTAIYRERLQAANSVTKQNFNPGLLQYRIPEGAGMRRRYDFPTSGDFDIDNADHLRALNHWLADMARLRGPLPNIPAASGADREWTDGECRYLQNIYASKREDFAVGKPPDMVKMIEDFNKVFVGRYMPGRVDPCSARTVSSANAWLDRVWKKDDLGNRLIHQQRYASATNILRHREEEEAEYRQFTG